MRRFVSELASLAVLCPRFGFGLGADIVVRFAFRMSVSEPVLLLGSVLLVLGFGVMELLSVLLLFLFHVGAGVDAGVVISVLDTSHGRGDPPSSPRDPNRRAP